MVLAIFMWVSKYGLHVAGSNNVCGFTYRQNATVAYMGRKKLIFGENVKLNTPVAGI